MLRAVTAVLRGSRHVKRMFDDRSELAKVKPVRALTVGLTKHGGRSHGRISIGRIGGGHKRLYRKIDFHRNLIGTPGLVIRKEYDPNRTAHIALVGYPQGILSYILAPADLQPGAIIRSGPQSPPQVGNTMPLQDILIGTKIHNIEIKPGRGGKILRAAGAFGTLMSKDQDGYAMVKLKSGEIRLFPLQCNATIGVVSNSAHQHRVLGKAGVNRWLGRKPVVRGIAMNPVDHPHGGRTNGGRPSVTPWGRPTRGKKTRNVRKSNRFVFKTRHAARAEAVRSV